METTFQAIIFDRDGVLTYFDMEPAIVYLEAIVQLPIEEIERRWWQWRDPVEAPTDLVEEQALFNGFWTMLAASLQLSPEQTDQLYRFDYTSVMRAYPDARTAMLEAHRQGLRIGVLSNFELASIDASLQAAGLADLVDVAVAAPVIGVAKPHPDAYLAVARALDVAPGHCLFLDDELSWVEGARAVGMRAYHVDRDRKENDLSQNTICNLSIVPQLLSLSRNRTL